MYTQDQHFALFSRLFNASEEELSKIAHDILTARLSCEQMEAGDADMSEENIKGIAWSLDRVINPQP